MRARHAIRRDRTRPARRTRTLFGTVGAVLGVTLFSVTSAFAYFAYIDASNGNAAEAIAGSLASPTGGKQNGIGTINAIPITWTAPVGYAPSGYTILRCTGSCTPTTAQVITNGGCSGTVSTNSCTDSDTGLTRATTYSYAVDALFHSWVSPVSSTFTGATLSSDGSGTLATPTKNALASSTGHTIVFTYIAATGGMSNGEVDIAVPTGWTAPVSTNAIGCTTANNGTMTFSGQTIKVSALTLAGGGTLTVTYGATSGGSCTASDGATSTSSLGAQTWQGQEKSTSGGTLTNISPSPSITVDAAPTITFPTTASPYNAGHNAGVETLHVTGTGFQTGLTVTAAGAFTINSIVSVTPTLITVTLTGRGGRNAKGSLTVTNPDGGTATTTNSLHNRGTYNG
jgi:hypothetical protein